MTKACRKAYGMIMAVVYFFIFTKQAIGIYFRNTEIHTASTHRVRNGILYHEEISRPAMGNGEPQV